MNLDYLLNDYLHAQLVAVNKYFQRVARVALAKMDDLTQHSRAEERFLVVAGGIDLM